MINLEEVLENVKEVAIKTGAMQKENLGRHDLGIVNKSSQIDLVTEIDKRSEQAIIEFIRKYYPEHSILAEESGLAEQQSDYLWIIDPLDGTTNYAQGLPIFCISIALQYKGDTVLGVVYTPVTGQMFTAIRGKGAFLNGRRLHVSAKDRLIDSVLATGFPYDIAANRANNLAYFTAITPKARAVRRMGAAAYDLACVAAGQFDGYWELKLSPWDVAAGNLLVEEAGGKIVHFRQDRGISLVAGNSTLCDKILAEIASVDNNCDV